MNRKTNWAISIVLILAIAALIIKSINLYEETNFEYGKDFNKVRAELNTPLIEKNWVLHELNDNYSLWANQNKGLSTNLPHHFAKRIYMNEGLIDREEDAYHYEFSVTTAYRLVIKSYYADSTTIYHFIKYHIGQYPPTTSWDLTLKQADSVLTSWNLEK